MRKLGLVVFAIATAGLVLAGVSLARGGDGDNVTSARLDGYQETPSISTHGTGTFEASISSNVIRFKLRYRNLEGGTVAQSHIHLGQRHTAGQVSAFLCGGSTKPACPQGSDVTVEGTIVPADVIGPAGQGIAAGQFDELVAAIRAGAAYANVHTATYPSGEIRGQLRGGKGHDNKGDDKD